MGDAAWTKKAQQRTSADVGFFSSMNNISLRDYFATHAPPVPSWFTSTIAKAKVEMIPDPARGPGYVKSNTVVIEETPLQREVRWRYAYADAMLVGAGTAPAGAAPAA